jgi:hemolysin activation/secretion protein
MVLVLMATLCSGILHAAPPDAGKLLNEQRQPGSGLPDRLPEPDEAAIERPALVDSGVKVTVKAFRFTGIGSLATEAELQALVADSIGKQLSIGELQGLAVRITYYLRDKKGYLLARAYLPKQDVTEGVIEIAIVAGRIDGNVRIERKQPARIKQSLLEGIASRAIPEGSAVRVEQIERATLLMKDLPGISAQASLEPGSTTGTTRIIITASEGPLVSGAISSDNFGDSYTGIWRGTGQLAINDPFGLGDQLSLSLTGAERQFQGRAACSLPLGASGLSWSLFYTGLYYELGGDLSNLNAKGRASTTGTGLTYPLMRSRAASILAGLGFEYQLLTDEANNSATKDRKIPVGSASLSGSFFDSFGGGGLTSANVSLYSGSLDLSGVAAADADDAAGPKTAGAFYRGTYILARLQRLTHSLSLFGSVRGQLAGGNLDSSQKFILGGPTGVRAYPTGEASGDEGHAFTVEPRYDLPFMPSWAATQLVGFIDTGWVKLHQTVWPGSITNISNRNDYWLSGGGAGLNIGKAGLYSIRFSYARTIDSNKGRSATNRDADNRSDNDRFWLQVVIWL